MSNRMGKQTVVFKNPPHIFAAAAVGGNEEGKGPLAKYFDKIFTDAYLGEASWEHAESKLQFHAVNMLLEKSGVPASNIDMMFGGDLINQCTSSYFAARDLALPLYGIYGACSTMGEGMQLAAMAVAGGFAKKTVAVTSSHFCSSEKQFRFPLEYGGQRPPTAQWTVTASGAVLITDGECIDTECPKITHITTGKIIDMGITDANNMGAAMAPAAADTLKAHFSDTGFKPSDYDLIVTGDLGMLGKELLKRLLLEYNIDIAPYYDDCGCMIYDIDRQDKHCGASGCGCSASVFGGYLFHLMQTRKIKKLLFMPTGALMSPLSCQQGDSISGIAHALRIEVN